MVDLDAWSIDIHRPRAFGAMRLRGVVLALDRDDGGFDGVIDRAMRTKYELECGTRGTLRHALRALNSLARRPCERLTVLVADDGAATRAREMIERARREGSWSGRTIEVTTARDGASELEALATLEEREAGAGATTLVVMYGDVVTDASLDAVVSAQLARGGAATCALATRRPWAEVERKAGKAPKGTRYVGLSASGGEVAFLAGGEKMDEAQKRLKLRRSMLDANGEIVIRTDITDVGIFALDAARAFDAIRERPDMKSLRYDLIPHFVAEQFRGAKDAVVAAYMVPADKYCVAVNTAKPALLEVSREIASEFHHLNERPLSKYDNVLDHSTVVGSKSTIGPGCVVAEQCVLGDKCSVKKSVIAAECKIGSGVKIVNSLILRGAVIGDGSQIQGCVIGPGAIVGARVVVKDSIVGAGYEVADDEDVDGETLEKRD